MTFRCRFRDWVLLAAILLAVKGSSMAGQAQSVILHLRNGDRLAGTILSETTNEVKLSTVWIKELTVPLAEIEKREIVPKAAVTVNNTNAPASTNLVAKTPKNDGMALPLAGNPPTNTNGWWGRWKGEASVGLDAERGATDHQLYFAKGKATYTQPYTSNPKEVFNEILTYDYAYGKTDGTLSDNRMGGSSKTDFDLTRKLYVYNLGSAFYDELRLINLHYEDGPGVGYHWITRTNLAVNLELGFNYQAELRVGSTNIGSTNAVLFNDDVYSVYGRLGQDLNWKLNKQMNLTEKIEYFPRLGYATQFRLRFETTLSYALMYHLALNFSLVDFYDTAPATSIPNNDLQIRTSLGVKF